MAIALKTSLSRLWYKLLPGAVREPVWHATRAAWASIVLRNNREARYRYAQYLVARQCNRAVIKVDEGFDLTVDLRDEGVGRVL